MKHPSDSERGQAIVILALMMIALLAFAALAIDGGNAYVERRRSQNAADASALAGARQIWKQQVEQNGNETDLLNIINQAAESNGVSAGPSSTNNPNVVAYYTTNFEGTTINPNQIGTLGFIPPGVTGIRVQASRQFNTFVGGLLKQLPAASAQATAVIVLPVPCGGSWAIFANASRTCPPAHVSISGGGQDIRVTNGGVYSHGDLQCNVSKATVELPYVWEYNGVVTNNQCASDVNNIVKHGTEPAPPAWNYDDFVPGGPIQTALGSNYHAIGPDDTISVDGLYYLSGDARHLDIAPSARHVTIVASGEIQFSGGIELTPYYSGLLLFSNSSGTGVKISGSNLSWQGLIYAPHGSVDMSAAKNISISGSVNGACVDLSGAGININYDPASCVPQRARVVLLK
jgi:Flp pilus assembly protein TadG